MYFLVKCLLPLFIVMMNDNSDSLISLSTVDPQRDSQIVVNPVCDTCDCVALEEASSLIEDSMDQEEDSETVNYAAATLRVNRWDLGATIAGILAALGTLIWMHFNAQQEGSKVQEQIELLQENNTHSKDQIENQKQALVDSAEQSRELNTTLVSSVDDIKHYLMENELRIRLTEKKDTIHQTFTYLWNSSFRHDTVRLKDGSIIQNQAVLDGIIIIGKEISSFNNLHPHITVDCVNKGKLCVADLDELSKKKKKGYDTAVWLVSSKQHFDELEQEMTNCINSLK